MSSREVIELVSELRADGNTKRLGANVAGLDGRIRTLNLLSDQMNVEIPDAQLALTRGRQFEFLSRVDAIEQALRNIMEDQ